MHAQRAVSVTAGTWHAPTLRSKSNTDSTFRYKHWHLAMFENRLPTWLSVVIKPISLPDFHLHLLIESSYCCLVVKTTGRGCSLLLWEAPVKTGFRAPPSLPWRREHASPSESKWCVGVNMLGRKWDIRKICMKRSWWPDSKWLLVNDVMLHLNYTSFALHSNLICM